MNSPKNYYRYTLSSRRGDLQAQPLGESTLTIEWDSAQDEGQFDYPSTLPNAITFTGEAYAYLLRLERSQYRCDYVTLVMERVCGTNFIGWFTGRMSLNDGNWDLDRCTVELKMDNIKPDQCFEDNKSTELNILTIGTARRTVFLTSGSITLEKVHYSVSADGEAGCGALNAWGGAGTPAAGNWIEYNEVSTTTGSGGAKHCTRVSDWAREVTTLACAAPSPGTEWKIVEDTCPAGSRKWARQAKIYNCGFTPPNYDDPTQTTTYSCSIIGDATEPISIDNGILLGDILAFFLSNFCPGISVVSDFFQINPETVSSVNYVTGLRTKTAFLTIFQKSDVKRPTADNDSSIGNMSWEDLMTDLISMFNVRWKIVGSTFRIEHVSFFTRNAGLNLTLPRYAKNLVGKRKYTYKTPVIPSREHFTFMEAGTGDFSGYDILYRDCVTADGRDNVINFAAKNITTDMQLVMGNPESDSDIVSDQGFVMMGTDYDNVNDLYFVITESPIQGGNALNNSLGWAQLQRDYYFYDRPARHGNMNGQDVTFITVQPTKKGDTITIPLCCGDNFDPNDVITTPLGAGIVDKAVFNLKDDTLALDLLYVADDGLTINTPPQANNDVVSTPQNTSVVIPVINNDSDPDAGDFIVQVIISGPPMHGSAIVNPDLSITYVPNTGYFGPDQLIYYVLDTWMQQSNIALVAITVRAPNQPPVAQNDNYTGNKNTVLSRAAPGVFINDSDDVFFILDIYDTISVNGGTVVIGTDGAITYTPPTGFVGVDSSTYRIKDSGGLTSTATIFYTIVDPNNPVANPDNYQTVVNTNISISAADGVLANDTTSIGVLAVTSGIFGSLHGGTIVMNTDGSFNYAPFGGFIGTDTFTYTVGNGTGTATGTVTFIVLPIIYARIQAINQITTPLHISCSNGHTDGGSMTTGTVRISFYSNSGGTTPFDVAGLSLTVNVRVSSQSAVGGPISNFDNAYHPVSGTTYDVYVNHQIFRQAKDCSGATVFYDNESYSLLSGNYVII